MQSNPPSPQKRECVIPESLWDFRQEIGKEVVTYLQNISILEEDIEDQTRENIIDIKELVVLMHTLTNQDYDFLDGITKKMRDGYRIDLKGKFLIYEYRDPTSHITKILKLLINLQNRNQIVDAELGLNAVLLLRLTYPFGKNIINRDWNELEGSLFFNGKEHAKIRTEIGITIKIIPIEEGCIVEVGDEACVLYKDRWVLVGNPLYMSHFFNINVSSLDHPKGLCLPTHLPINDLKFSRVSLMILLKDDQLWFFERGFRNGNLIPEQGDLSISYNSDVLRKNGTYGISVRNIK